MKISVIVPLYNNEKYIKKCLTSLLNQTHKNLEIIVIDDKSTDNGLNIAQSIVDERIKIIKNKKNLGIGKTRNIGLSLATGDYISFVDSDDYIDKRMYERYLLKAEKDDLDLLTSDYYKVIDGEKKYFKVDSFEVTNINKNANIINLINYGPCNKLYKRDLIINAGAKFSETTKFEDVVFVSSVISKAKKIGYLNEAYYNYVVHENSETTTIDDRTFDIFEVVDMVRDIYSNLDGTKELEYFVINEITRYMLKARYEKRKENREKLINQGYSYLYSINAEWRHNKIYRKTNIFKRIIKNNKTLLLIYCKMFSRGVR